VPEVNPHKHVQNYVHITKAPKRVTVVWCHLCGATFKYQYPDDSTPRSDYIIIKETFEVGRRIPLVEYFTLDDFDADGNLVELYE